MAYVPATSGGYEGPEIPDSMYELTCKKVSEWTPTKPDEYGKMNPKFRLELHGVTADGESFIVEPLMNQTFSNFPGRTPSTLFVYADAFGCNPDPSTGFDTDELIDKKAMGFVQTAEEPGSWPRVTNITKIKAGGKMPAPKTALPPPPRTAIKAIILPDGTVDWDTFWKETERLGATKDSVIKAWGGDEDIIKHAEPIDVANWLHDWADRLAPV